MKSLESLKLKTLSLKNSFNFKDFFGFSSLVFGLLLSNTSLNKSNANMSEVKTIESHIEMNSITKKDPQNVKKSKKKAPASIL